MFTGEVRESTAEGEEGEGYGAVPREELAYRHLCLTLRAKEPARRGAERRTTEGSVSLPYNPLLGTLFVGDVRPGGGAATCDQSLTFPNWWGSGPATLNALDMGQEIYASHFWRRCLPPSMSQSAGRHIARGEEGEKRWCGEWWLARLPAGHFPLSVRLLPVVM